MSEPTPSSTVNVVPRIRGFLITYILFGLPGFFTSIIILLIALLILAGTAAGFSKVDATSSSDQKMELTTITNGKSKSGVLVYDLTGSITSGNFDSSSGSEKQINTNKIAKDFEKIKKNNNIKNVVFRYNTPGGEIYASEVLGDLISNLQTSKSSTKPNIYFDQLSASGGLWSSYKAGGYIMGSEYGTTGSIGVIMRLPNFKGIADKIGYSQTVIKSSASKDIGDPFKDITPEEKEFFQKDLNVYYNKFKSIVSKNRNLTLDQVESLATGLTWPNTEAKQKGLIDEIGTLDSMIAKAASDVNLESGYSVYKVENESSFLKKILDASLPNNFFGVANIPAPFSLKSGELYAIDERRVG